MCSVPKTISVAYRAPEHTLSLCWEMAEWGFPPLEESWFGYQRGQLPPNAWHSKIKIRSTSLGTFRFLFEVPSPFSGLLKPPVVGGDGRHPGGEMLAFRPTITFPSHAMWTCMEVLCILAPLCSTWLDRVVVMFPGLLWKVGLTLLPYLCLCF